MANPRSTSLPHYFKAASGQHNSQFQSTVEEPLDANASERNTSANNGGDDTSPIVKLLNVLQSLMSGVDVDMAAVKWLWVRISTGDFVSGAFPTHAPQLALRDTERDVGASLAALLGATYSRRASRRSDTSVGTGRRSSLQSTWDGVEALQLGALDSAPHLDAQLDDSSADEDDTPPPIAAPILEVESVLGTAESWGFDAFKLAEVTGGQPLAALGFWLLNTRGVVQDCGLDSQRLTSYLREVDKRYARPSRVPYHNNTHAADVLQQIHMLLTVGGLAQGTRRDPLTQLASYLAAMVHDVDHQGVTNDYLTRTEHRLALLYNDASPQENHHLATAFELLQDPELDFMSSMPRERRAKLRKLVIAMVLATDMKMHIGLVSAFQSKVDVQKMAVTSQGPVPERRMSDPGRTCAQGKNRAAVVAGSIFDSDSNTGKALVMQMALKCADLGHMSAPWHIHSRWVKCLEEELFLQGDKECAAQLPISPLMNRSRDGVSKSQVDFLERVALPMFRLWTSAFPGASPMVANTQANLERWKELKASRKPH